MIDNKGFTLLELLIAMTILAVGLLGIAALQITAIEGNGYGKELTLASSLISDQIEEFKNMDTGDIANKEQYIVFENKQPKYLDSAPSSGGYMKRTAVVQNGPEGTKDVEIKIVWVDPDGNTRTFSSRTLIN